MKRHTIWFLSCITVLTFPVATALAQGGGGFGGSGGFAGSENRRGGSDSDWPRESDMDYLSIPNYITVEGTAEIRVAPEKIRVVLAVTSQAPTAAECRQKNSEQVKALLKRWQELGVADDDIVEDFIALLPVYEWRREDRDGQEIRIQQLEGYRMQSNVHVRVSTEAKATEAVNAALEEGIADIVTFDYWSSQLDEQKREARKQAMKAAKEKAETLLSAFEESPPLINVREQTAAFFPSELYRTYENVLEESVDWPSNYRDVPRIRAFRPKMTFLGNLEVDSDVQADSLPMRAEITVVSTVRLYFQSPAHASEEESGQSRVTKSQRKLQLAEKAGIMVEINLGD